jgi:anti-anti-sigma factor
MTDDARRRQPPERRSPGGGPLGAGADTGGGQEPPVLDQVFDGDSLYALRAAVAAHGLQAGLAEGRVGDLVLAVHELAANAVRHGAGWGRLRVWNTGEVLRCEVTDDGAPQAAGGSADSGSRDAATWRIEPGHGLWLIRQVADQTSVQASASGTVATVSFALGPPGALPPFHVAQRFRDGCAVLSVTGGLDLGSADQFASAVGELVKAAPRLRLVLDLSGLTWWDSSGLAALIIARQWVSARPGARMVVAGLPGYLVQRLRAVGLDGQFTLTDTVAEAVGMLAPPG